MPQTTSPRGTRVERGIYSRRTATSWSAPASLRLRFDTFASHLIVDLGLDVAQVSRILGHARIALDVYTHLFDDARHTREFRRGWLLATLPRCFRGIHTQRQCQSVMPTPHKPPPMETDPPGPSRVGGEPPLRL